MTRSAYGTFGRVFSPKALTAMRLQAGLSTAKLALLIFQRDGEDRKIERYEAGEMQPAMLTLLSLCRVLQCRVDDLAPRLSENRIVPPEVPRAPPPKRDEAARRVYFQKGRA